MRRKIAAGNWKMNGTGASLSELEALVAAHPKPSVEVILAPPATLIERAARIAGPVTIAGQDCHATESGAHTGDLSAGMLRDAGARAVIVGHSERRADHGEEDEHVRAKASAAIAAGLTAIVCVGETLEERDAANTLQIIGGQLAGSVPDEATGENVVIAYEPVWAIGTGRTASTDEIGEVHDFIHSRLERRFGGAGLSMRILYGGSVKPENAAEIFAVSNVDGALVGGASLKAEDFGGIVEALEKS